jgi:hypothetical protein
MALHCTMTLYVLATAKACDPPHASRPACTAGMIVSTVQKPSRGHDRICVELL